MKTRALTRAAMLAGLTVVVLYLGSVINVMNLTCLGAAAMLPMFSVHRDGLKWGVLVWVSAGLLSLMLIPDKAVALAYALLLGHYSLWKYLIERLNRKKLEWVLKLLIFNAILAVYWFVFSRLFVEEMDPDSTLAIAGWIMWLVYNLVFQLYDFAAGLVLIKYFRRVEGA